jgi:hypothetical protein
MEYFYLNDQRQDSFSLLCINFQTPHCKSRLKVYFKTYKKILQSTFHLFFALWTFVKVHGK